MVLTGLSERNLLKNEYDPLTGQYEIDIKEGKVLRISPMGRVQEVMYRRRPGLPLNYESYRNPYVLIFDSSSAVSSVFNSLVADYLDS